MNSNPVTDWLWNAGFADNDAERRYFYNRVRRIDPKDAVARQSLEDSNKKQMASANSGYPLAPNQAKLLQEWTRAHIFRTPATDV